MNYAENGILASLDEIAERVEEAKETLLTNLVMISETPSPTFSEEERTKFMVERFAQNDLQNCSTDEKGNVIGILPGEEGDRNILVVAHLDTIFSTNVNHTVTIEPDCVRGVGLGDNGLGLATLMTLPQILAHLGIRLGANLVFIGSARSLGEGDLEGLRFFLDNHSLKGPITTGICLEGVKLGRLSYTSVGMLRGQITYRVPEEYDWTRFHAGGAIVDMSEIIGRLLEIPLPLKPRTSIVLGSIRGGNTFNQQPSKAVLRFEIRSESEKMVDSLAKQITFLTDEISSKTGALICFKEISRRQPGGTQFSHPLNTAARRILETLGLPPRILPSTSELSAFIDKKIPAVTVGLTKGENVNEPDEQIEITPIKKGLAQLVGILLTVDGGIPL